MFMDVSWSTNFRRILIVAVLGLFLQVKALASDYTAQIQSSYILFSAPVYYKQKIMLRIVKDGAVIKDGVGPAISANTVGTTFQSDFIPEMVVPFRLEITDENGDIIDVGKIKELK